MKNEQTFEIKLDTKVVMRILRFIERKMIVILVGVFLLVSISTFIIYYQNGLGLAYNDARSHLDIGRRVVEGLKPGLAQLGSVWLPLPHILMVPTIWNDFMWHSGLAGALQSMISFVVTCILIYLFLREIGVGIFGRLVGIAIFAFNINVLYLQSTAMTELLLIATMMAGAYELLLWFKRDHLLNLVKAAFWIMLSTLIRYDGWFLLFLSTLLILFYTWKKHGYKTAEGMVFLFCTLAGFGIILWLLWNQLIFKDAFYFAFGPYSAHAQQEQLDKAGVLATKGDLLLSIKVYLYALAYNSNTFIILCGAFAATLVWFDKRIIFPIKIALITLLAPLIFNILALFLGHSVLFIQGISGDTWFNARYGIMMMSSVAIFIGYLIDRLKVLRLPLVGFFILLTVFSFTSYDAVTIDDARVGSSQKNVTEVSGWLATHAKDREGFVLISAASHDAIIFSSGLPMKKFIHEGTGAYWTSATIAPDRWARWVIMRTNDTNDSTFREIKDAPGFVKYKLVGKYPFADIYELKEEFLSDLNTKPILGPQK